MRHFAVLTGRELRSHLPAALVALAAATLPWIAPWLPGISRHSTADVRLGTAAVVAVLVATGLALAVGAGLASRDLVEGRLGFYLTLPVRPTAVWLARLLAGLLVVYGATAMVLLPAAGTSHDLGLGVHTLLSGLPAFWESLLSGLVALVVLPAVLLLFTHQLAVGLRARTPWILLEVAAWLAVGWLCWGALLRLLRAGAWVETSLASSGTLTAALLAWVFAGAAGISRGGALASRFHRAQALVASLGLLLAGGAAAVYSSWVLTPGASAVARVDAVIAPQRGAWVAALVELEGRPTYTPWVLYDRAGGDWLRLSPDWAGGRNDGDGPVVFTTDGRAALWRRPAGHAYGSAQELVWIDLASRPRLVETGIELHRDDLVALAADGSRIAVRRRDELALWGEGGRRLVAAGSLPRRHAGSTEALSFAGRRVRLAALEHRDGGTWLRLRELDPDARSLRAADAVPLRAAGGALLSFAADGGRLLVDRPLGPTSLHDAASGERLADLAERAGSGGRRVARFLADGRVVTPAHDGRGLRLRIFSPDGELLAEHGIEAGGWVVPVRQTPAGIVLAMVVNRRWELREVDLATGETRSLGERLAPAAARGLWATSPLPPPDAAWLAVDATGRLVEVGPGGAGVAVLPRPNG